VYREVVEPERLVFTNIATDNEGNPVLDGLQPSRARRVAGEVARFVGEGIDKDDALRA
jgi:uncharacterized protein YndB with AHSA1/START domain